MNSAALDSIREAADRLGGEQSVPDWLSQARERGLTEFVDRGFPGARDEDWKYTRLNSLAGKSFAQPADTAAPRNLPSECLADLPGPRLVFLDGIYSPTLSRIGDEVGLRLLSLAEAISENDPLVREQLANGADRGKHRFANLSDALLADGAVVDIAPGAHIAAAVYLVFLSTGSETPTLCSPRILVRLGENAAATLIEHHVGLENNQNLVNVMSEVSLQAGARLTYYTLQEASPKSHLIGALHVRQARASQLLTYSFNLGGRMVRNDLHSQLEGDGAGIEMYGLYLAGDRQHVDNHTRVDHIATHTSSRQDYKGVLHGRGRAVFNGKAHIHAGASGTEASQSNDNLLLSEQAEIDTKPELEIYNDDVKCSHGATVGQLDKQALFYLRSRGIDEETARVLLTFAFAETVLQRVAVSAIRARVENSVIDMLPQSDRIREFV